MAEQTMVKRVARVLGNKRTLWKDDLAAARRAIEAMREPTEAMLAAGWNIEMNSPVGEDPTLPNWQAMIDAALKE